MASGSLVLVVSFPNWYRSIRGLGIGRRKGGWSRVVGNCLMCWAVVAMSPCGGISARRA